MFGLSIMYNPNKRYRQQSNLRYQSSDEQLRIVRDSKPYAHECPHCHGVFPSKSGNFKRCMSVHMTFCLARKQQRNAMGDLPAGDVEVVQREEIMEGKGEFIDEEMMVRIGGGDQCEGSQYDDFEQEGGTIIHGEIVEADIVVSPAVPLHRFDLTDILAFLDEKLGVMEGEDSSSESSDVVSEKKRNVLCGAVVVDVVVSDLPIKGPGWKPHIPARGSVRGYNFFKDEYLRSKRSGRGPGGGVGRGAAEGGKSKGETGAEERVQEPPTRKAPSKKLLKYQRRVVEVYTPPKDLPEGVKDTGPFKKSNKVDGESKDFRDLILLNSFMNKHGLSLPVCDELLQLVADICANHKWKWAMYTDAENLK